MKPRAANIRSYYAMKGVRSNWNSRNPYFNHHLQAIKKHHSTRPICVNRVGYRHLLKNKL